MSENPGDKVPIQEVYGVGINKEILITQILLRQ